MKPVKLEFKGLNSFSERAVIDFEPLLKSGIFGIFGETGSGTSTIVNLVCRFYEPAQGRILIDGVDYRERSILWLQSHLG